MQMNDINFKKINISFCVYTWLIYLICKKLEL